MKKWNLRKVLGGIFIGVANGLFGAGGGILAVPILRSQGMDDRSAHASSVAVILPVSLFTLTLYLLDGRLNFSEGLPYIIPGIIGGFIGTKMLARVSGVWLHRAFGLLIIFAGMRFIMR